MGKMRTTDWRVSKKDTNIITAIICGKLITIDLSTFDILFHNNFKIKCNSVDAAKKKAADFFSQKSVTTYIM